jgi:hypothetical protein
MLLQKIFDGLQALGKSILQNDAQWQAAAQQAELSNGWFTQANCIAALHNVATQYLASEVLQQVKQHYNIAEPATNAKVGIVAAGNIPLVGLHDVLCVLLSGHIAVVKLSSKDEVLMKAVIQYLYNYDAVFTQHIVISPMLKSCDAYIATGSNNSGRYFEYYFSKYPNIIRTNRTSVAVLTGMENETELQALAHDCMSYFGLGCRNVTHICVPEQYNFELFLNSFKAFADYPQHHKYKNNYDYNLALYLLNNKYYMTNDIVLLVENEQLFSPISTLHYSYYKNAQDCINSLQANNQVQAVVSNDTIKFGTAQAPSFMQYADGVDTMQFLQSLNTA